MFPQPLYVGDPIADALSAILADYEPSAESHPTPIYNIGAQTRRFSDRDSESDSDLPSLPYVRGREPTYCPCNDYNRCQLCANKKQAHIRRNVETMLSSDGEYLSVTLTVPSSDLPLVRQLRDLLRGWSRLKRKTVWTRHIKGGVYSVEVTKINAFWHPHLHILADGSDLSESDLLRAWSKLTDADHVAVRVVDSTDYQANMARYVAAPANADLFADADLNREFISARTRLRLKGTFGTFRGQPLTRRRGCRK